MKNSTSVNLKLADIGRIMEGLRCPSLHVSHLKASPNSTWYPANSAVYVDCESGYKLRGLHLISCNNGTWSPGEPECKQSSASSAQFSKTLIVTVATIASVVALVIILCAAYMLTRNWRRERAAKRKQEDYQKQILDSTNAFVASQDCVGMPPLVYENISSVIRGRPTSSSTSSATTCTASTDISLDGELSPTSDKVFSY